MRHLTANDKQPSLAAFRAVQMGPLGQRQTTTKGDMKKLIGYSSLVALMGLASGCVAPIGPVGGLGGSLYTDVSGPVLATSRDQAGKVGEATAQGILGVVTGDCSIKAAAAS